MLSRRSDRPMPHGPMVKAFVDPRRIARQAIKDTYPAVATTNEKTVIRHSLGLWFRYLAQPFQSRESAVCLAIPCAPPPGGASRSDVAKSPLHGVESMYDPWP
jgi:hypothetical protein